VHVINDEGAVVVHGASALDPEERVAEGGAWVVMWHNHFLRGDGDYTPILREARLFDDRHVAAGALTPGDTVLTLVEAKRLAGG
jgi:alkylhydroperoxidase family enzyme